MKKLFMMVMLLLLFCSTCIASYSPSKMKIGDVDGQWTYIGRYSAPKNFSGYIKDFVLYAQPYNMQTEQTKGRNMYDVYFYHVHNNELYNQEEGVGCRWYVDEKTGATYRLEYNCVLKLVLLDATGKPVLESGPDGQTIIVSITGRPHGPQQIFRLELTHCCTYDAVSHQLLSDIKDFNELNRVSRISSQAHNILNKFGDKEFGDNMYRRAARMSNCPVNSGR